MGFNAQLPDALAASRSWVSATACGIRRRFPRSRAVSREEGPVLSLHGMGGNVGDAIAPISWGRCSPYSPGAKCDPERRPGA